MVRVGLLDGSVVEDWGWWGNRCVEAMEREACDDAAALHPSRDWMNQRKKVTVMIAHVFRALWHSQEERVVH